MPLDFRAFPILYVDGDAASALRFREILGEQFSVTTANCGAQALRTIEQTDAALTTIMLAEYALPDMTATELFEQTRVLRPELVRLLTTAQLTPEIAEAAINRGRVCGYMAKPWLPEKLCDWLTATLETMLQDTSVRSMEMSLWHGGQVAAATTIYEELVHELSNPLGALEINASLVADLLREILEQRGVSTDTDTDLDVLRSSVQTACEAHTDSLAAIDQMKNLVSRMRQGGMARPRIQGRCDPARVIEATVRVVRAEVEKVAQLEVRVADAPTVQMEASVLGQILLNLLLNAAQAVPAHKRAENRIQVLASPIAEKLLISVRDNGPGIVPGLQERVFEPFFTTKENGTGLGLAICRELATRAHGTISVENLRGGGAQFDIRVPIAK
ncbi:MAG TPA: hybrid sensor histidine kinase/response regulator [Polyangiales bacterium]|nr:hybrid sensor histidine kinase/response regulator [Polyangiales bacterium]